MSERTIITGGPLPDGIERVCCRARAAFLFGAGSPPHLAMVAHETNEIDRWRDGMAKLEREVKELHGVAQMVNRRFVWLRVALGISAALNGYWIGNVFQ